MQFKDFLEIDEMSTVSRSSNMFIAVNPDIHRVGDEYFKLYNANILNNADKVISIHFQSIINLHFLFLYSAYALSRMSFPFLRITADLRC